MVRQLLGNIRGPRGFQGEQGEQGPEGDTGGFNGEVIGVNNLINLKDFEPYDTSSSLSYNLKDGVLYYNNHPYSFSAEIRLTPGEYTFSVEDFTINPDYASGRIRFSLTYDGSEQTTALLNPGDTHSFTLTTSGLHRLVIRVSNVPRVDGQLEKMMLVKGEYTSDWQPSIRDSALRTINTGNLINNSINFQGVTNTGNIVAEDGVNKYVGNTHVTVDIDGDVEVNTVYTLSWDNEGLSSYNQILLYDADGVFTNINYGSTLIERNIVENGRSYIVFQINRATPFKNPARLRIGTNTFTSHKSSMYCLNQSNNATWQPSTQDLINHLG